MFGRKKLNSFIDLRDFPEFTSLNPRHILPSAGAHNRLSLQNRSSHGVAKWVGSTTGSASD